MTSTKHGMRNVWVLAVPVALAAACAAGGGGDKRINGGTGGNGGVGAVGGSGGINIDGGSGVGGSAGSIAAGTCSADCQDFPAAPVFEPGAPTNAPDLFGAPDPNTFTGTAPCVLEPQLSSGSTPGALFPANWLAPRFRFSAQGDLFEIRVSSEVQRNELVVYTTTPQWVMPKEMWKTAAANNAGKPMTVTIRALTTASPGTQSGVVGDINIAPVNAGGSMVFWTVKDSNPGPDAAKLLGFSVGDEAVVEVLAPKTVQFNQILHEGGRDLRGEFGGGKVGFLPGEVQCIGCHTSTPDGTAVVFTDDWPWDKPIASVEEETAGQVPAYVTPGARALLKMPWGGTQSMSGAHWAAGDRILISGYGDRTQAFSTAEPTKDRIAWIDLETQAQISDAVPTLESGQRDQARDARNAAIAAAQGSAWGFLALTGETASAVNPDFSNDGTRLLYVSTDVSKDGHPAYIATRADVMMVPYNDRAGGAVQPLAGAADPNLLEYYPAFSANDKLVAFTRAPRGTDGPYYNRNGDIYVVGADGGQPVRLSSNDPVACAGDNIANGLLNSWPKWSPTVTTVGGKTYYFVIFSSARVYPGAFNIPRGPYTPATLDTRSSQLYMAAIVVDDATGEVTTYPAVYLWNQYRVVAAGAVTEVQNSNLTPAWDDFVIPPVEIPR